MQKSYYLEQEKHLKISDELVHFLPLEKWCQKALHMMQHSRAEFVRWKRKQHTKALCNSINTFRTSESIHCIDSMFSWLEC